MYVCTVSKLSRSVMGLVFSMTYVIYIYIPDRYGCAGMLDPDLDLCWCERGLLDVQPGAQPEEVPQGGDPQGGTRHRRVRGMIIKLLFVKCKKTVFYLFEPLSKRRKISFGLCCYNKCLSVKGCLKTCVKLKSSRKL